MTLMVYVIATITVFSTRCVSHQVTFWQNENFTGPKLRYANYRPDECLNIYDKWPHDVHWLDTEGVCLQIWTQDDCQGDVQYVMSRRAEYTKVAKRIKSFRTCETSRTYRYDMVHAALDQHSIEHRFWQVCFRVLGLFKTYQNQVKRQGRFISWNFILHTQVPRSKREQYRDLLISVGQRFKQFSVSKLNSTNYNLDDFKLISHLSDEVVKSRVKQLIQFPANDEKYPRHHQIIQLWGQLSANIKEAYSHLHRYLTKQKWMMREACEHLPGCHIYFRIINPQDISLA